MARERIRGGRGAGRTIAVLAGAVVLGSLAALGLRNRSRRLLRERVKATGAFPRVVIVGGGAGGLYCTLGLKDAPVETTLVSRVNHYVYEALLYQVATGRLDEHEVTLPLRDALGKAPDTTVLLAEVNGIDLERREVHLRAHPHSLLYDYLVIATGVEPDYFGHDEWAAFAPALKTVADAVELRDSILGALEEAERAEVPSPETTTFVVVGGGPTGVEMAAAFAEMVRAIPQGEFKRFDPRTSRIVLVEASGRLLPGFSQRISEEVRTRLGTLGVEVMLGQPVETVDAEGLTAGGRRIASRHIVWAAGTRATPLGRLLGTPTDGSGRIIVGPDLSLPAHPEVFAIGDIAHAEKEGKVLPELAPVALEEAHYVARAIARRVAGRPPAGPFRYVDRGKVATIGRGYGVLETLGSRVKVTGPVAKLAWIAAHLVFQVPLRDKARMFGKWTWRSMGTRPRARVITGPDSMTSAEMEKADKAAPTPLAR